MLLAKIKSVQALSFIGVIFLTLTIFLGPYTNTNEYLLQYERLNMIGWVPVFITGILVAEIKERLHETSALKMSFHYYTNLCMKV